jgi:hypothetical protein
MKKLYHVLSSIRVQNGGHYEKGIVSNLSKISSAGIDVLLERGDIAPLVVPPLEVAFGDDAEEIRLAGYEDLADLLGRTDLSNEGLGKFQAKINQISADIGVVLDS